MTEAGPRRLIVAADGGSRGNPGPAGYGAVVLDAATGEVLAEERASIGHATNNVAEYSGLIAGLRAAARIAPGAAAAVRMDSKLVIEQMSGHWKIKHPDLIPLAARATEAAGQLGSVSYTWVPRAQNAHADRLANEAMDAAAGRPRRASPGVSRSVDKSPSPHTVWRPDGQAPVTTLLLRHGETALSGEKRFSGTVDVPLTERGLAQARAAAAWLAAQGSVDAVITSPLRRAQQTAAEVAAATGARVRVDDRFREAGFGKWEGLTFAEASEQWPEEMAAWRAGPDAPLPGGESFAAVRERAGAALDDLLAADPGTRLVIVSHVTPIKELVARAVLAPRPRRCSACSSMWPRCARSAGTPTAPCCTPSTTPGTWPACEYHGCAAGEPAGRPRRAGPWPVR